MKPLAISLYCVWQWWEQHYDAAQGRPERIDFDWLDATWLGRMRQLHDWFGDLGIGNPSLTLDTGFVSRLLPYHTMIVPVVWACRRRSNRSAGGRTILPTPSGSRTWSRSISPTRRSGSCC